MSFLAIVPPPHIKFEGITQLSNIPNYYYNKNSLLMSMINSNKCINLWLTKILDLFL